MKNKINYLLIFIMVAAICSITINVCASSNRVTRINGSDRYGTSIEIGEKFVEDESADAVILASGKDYPDALTGSILSKKYNAPIILVDYDPKTSMEQIAFIQSKLNPNGKVYLLGGEKNINNNYINYLKQIGYKNIERIGGVDRYETNTKIVEKAEVKEGTPVIIASSKSFADALSMSPISGAKQYPILLTEKDTLTSNAIKQMEKIKPKEVFIAGGVGAISDEVQNEIKDIIANIKGNEVIRLSGKDRYETSMEILNHFSKELKDESIFIASGKTFPDALSGSALASKTESPILLSNSQTIIDSKPELDNYKSVNILGGKFSVEKFTEQRLNDEETFLFYIDSIYEENGKIYMNGTFGKFMKDIEELEEYCKYYKITSSVMYVEGREPCIADVGQDIPMSTPVKVEISNDVEVKILDWPNRPSDVLVGTKIITFDDFKNNIGWTGRAFFDVEFKDNKISKMVQEFRP
ncbi:cell wall-binding repeat-containing protein [Clostridium senegalense]